MLPSEQQGLMGMWAEQGANPDDMMAMMRRAWPTGRAVGRTYWRT